MTESFVPPPGFETLGEHYRLTRKLGEGAFGEVYLAHHDLLDQDFAVKVLKPELCEDQDSRERFLDEARALIRFSHPNVVQLRHVGEQAGRLYLVMDLVQGEPMDEVLQREGAFPEDRALRIMQQILAGLEAAHAAGIIHRDLKPSNLIYEFREDGQETVRILDFGLSKLSTLDGMQSTHRSMTGTIIGTLAYMSPEQLQGERDIDARSDIFAAGLVLLEMLQGHHPYPGDSGIVVAAKLLRDPVPPVAEKVASVLKTSTQSAVSTALERDRDARFPSVSAFSQALLGKGPPSDTSRVTTVQDAQRELARQEALRRQQASPASSGAASTAAVKRGSPLVWLLPLLLVGGGALWWFVLRPKDAGPPSDERVAEAARPETPPQPTGPDADPDPDPLPEPEPQPDPLQKPEPQPDPLPKPEPQPDPLPKPEPQPDPLPKPEPQPDPLPKPEPQPDPLPKPEPQPDPLPKPEPQPEPLPEPAIADPALTPEACCSAGVQAAAAGDWASARSHFLRAVADPKAGVATHVGALRGAAETYIDQADALARRGKVKEALGLLAKAQAFLENRLRGYGADAVNPDVVRLQMGFGHMHLAEVHTEQARWLRVLGRLDEATTHLKPARDSFEFAWPSLDRDGANYAEFLIRRARLQRLTGAVDEAYKDLSDTTRTNNVEVPIHAWVMHAKGARHLAEHYWQRSDWANARHWADQAVDVSKKGVSWYEKELTREQWLSFVRNLYVDGALLEAEGDALPLFGLAGFWLRLAKEAPVSGHRDPRLQQANLLTGEAVHLYLGGRSELKRQRKEQAGRQLAQALAKVDEALRLRAAVTAAGGPLPAKYPHQVRASVLQTLGRSAEAQSAAKAAGAAAARNPD